MLKVVNPAFDWRNEIKFIFLFFLRFLWLKNASALKIAPVSSGRECFAKMGIVAGRNCNYRFFTRVFTRGYSYFAPTGQQEIKFKANLYLTQKKLRSLRHCE